MCEKNKHHARQNGQISGLSFLKTNEQIKKKKRIKKQIYNREAWIFISYGPKCSHQGL